jgi:glycosyltransferase involved in cell wall biosynthesis
MQTETNCSISIVIPVYNGAAYLNDALDSALAQTRPADEILIVDDASTDDTPKLIANLPPHPKLRIQRLPERLIAPAAWNAAIRLSQGTHFIILAHDDRIHPEFIARTAPIVEQNPDVGFVLTGYDVIDETGKKTESRPIEVPSLIGHTHYDDFIDEIVNVRGMYFCDTGSLVARKAFDAVGGFDERYRGGVYDYDFYIRLAGATATFGIADSLADYRIHAANMSADLHRDDKGDGDILFAKLAQLSSLSELQKRDLARHLSYFQFNRFTRAARSTRASVDDVKAARNAVRDRLNRWASSNSPFAKYVSKSPPRFRTQLAWSLGGTTAGIQLLRMAARLASWRKSRWD